MPKLRPWLQAWLLTPWDSLMASVTIFFCMQLIHSKLLLFLSWVRKLCSMLKDVLKQKPNVDVVKLQKSGGVVSRNSKIRAISRNQRIREYFYGLSNDLSPHSSITNFSD